MVQPFRPGGESARPARLTTSQRERYIAFSLLVVSLVALLLVGELAIRTWHFARWNVSFVEGLPRQVGNLSPIVHDPRLGWRATPHYRFEGTRRSADGSEYPVRMSQDQNGFRFFGDPGAGRPKVFVVGDSFTQAVEVSDDDTYYSRLQRASGDEVFAYGGGGYGSLQEFMILDQFFDVVRPDIVVWQYSTNDLVNNSPELEAASIINNNGLVRPYWVDGRIVHLLARQSAVETRRFSLRYCRVCYLLLNRIDRLRAMVSSNTIESDTSPGERGHAMFRRAVNTTEQIMGMVRSRVGGVPVVGFIVGEGDPYGTEYVEALTQISQRHQIQLMDVEGPVLAAEAAGTVVRAEDRSHWNEAGHRIAADALTRALRDMFPPHASAP